MEKYLSKVQVKAILDEAPINSDKGKIVQALADKGYKIEGFNDQPVVKEPGALESSFKSGVDQSKAGYNMARNASNPLELLAGGTKLAAGVINTVTSPLAAAISPVTKPIGKAVNYVADKISDTELFKGAAGNQVVKPDGTIEFVQNAKSGGERIADATADLSVIAGAVAGTKILPAAITKVEGIVSNTVKQLTTKSEAQIEATVLKNYSKGVKPSIAGKNTPAAVNAYKDNVVSAVKTIKDNAPNLSFVDDVGETITGQTPKSLQQLSEAIEQTKKTVFNQYDSLSKQAGKAGIEVDMKPIASELDSVINNKALRITNPKAIEYATSVKDRLNAIGKLDATTAQEVVQNYNKSLEAFYKNPSYETATNAAIDALLANKVREALDEGISGLTGVQYSALKKQYGALKSIEKDVVKATLRDARKNVKGLIDYTDIFTGGQVVSGLLSLNPALVASGVTQKVIAEFYKFLNNPNRAIEKMFSAP